MPAIPTNDDYPDCVVCCALGDAIDHRLDHFTVIGVVYLGPVDGDGGDTATVDVEKDDRVGHGRAPLGRTNLRLEPRPAATQEQP
jgi:hypothetical protein